MSKVSIIVPVYNGSKVLPRCVESILNQDFTDFELLLIDDGSKDDSFKIMSSYAEKDPRVISIHKENGGVSSTRNTGLSLAKGKYIQFVDVDDFLPFDSVKMMVREMEDNDVQMVIGDFYRMVQDKVSQKGSIHKGGIITRNSYADSMMLSPADFYYGVLWNKMYRKDILDKYNIRMDDNISFCEDMIFNLEYLLHVNNIFVVKAPVYYYVLTEGSLVEKNMNLESIIKMKTSVVKYYSDFYQNILDEKDYDTRKPFIYSYLIAFSTDAFSIPFIDKVRKIGDSAIGKNTYDDLNSDIKLGHLSEVMLEKLLESSGQQNKLSLNEMKILYLLYDKKEGCGYEEIEELTGLDNASCAFSLARLVASGYVRLTDINLLSKNKVAYEDVQGPLDVSMVRVTEDLNAILMKGFSAEEKEQYRSYRDRITANLLDKLIQ